MKERVKGMKGYISFIFREVYYVSFTTLNVFLFPEEPQRLCYVSVSTISQWLPSCVFGTEAYDPY